jgi:hypothetical protein
MRNARRDRPHLTQEPPMTLPPAPPTATGVERSAIAPVDGALMLLDDLVPRFDAVRREHRVIDGDARTVHAAVLRADFLRAVTSNPGVRTLFAARSAGERMAARVRGREVAEPAAPDSLRLVDMGAHGEWVRIADDPPREIAFGAVGRFWGGETMWEEIDATDFAAFDRPGFAKICCNFSLRPYGRGRTLVSYEVRTVATDDESRRAFLRYWRAVTKGVGVVMRSQLRVVEREAATPA